MKEIEEKRRDERRGGERRKEKENTYVNVKR